MRGKIDKQQKYSAFCRFVKGNQKRVTKKKGCILCVKVLYKLRDVACKGDGVGVWWGWGCGEGSFGELQMMQVYLYGRRKAETLLLMRRMKDRGSISLDSRVVYLK